MNLPLTRCAERGKRLAEERERLEHLIDLAASDGSVGIDSMRTLMLLGDDIGRVPTVVRAAPRPRPQNMEPSERIKAAVAPSGCAGAALGPGSVACASAIGGLSNVS